MSVNRVVLVGRLTRDPETSYTPQGVAVAKMGIAVDSFSKDENGEYKTDFFNIVAWRRSAEFAQNHLTKGRLIAVDGRLQTRSWVAQDGTKRSVVEIVAESVQSLERKGDSGPSSDSEMGGEASAPPRATAAPTSAPAQARPAPARSAPPPPADDDLDESDPFADE